MTEQSAAPARSRTMKMKFARQDLTRHVAHCVTCGGSNEARNAQAWASIHVNSNGGHRVHLRLDYVVADRDLDEEARAAVIEGSGRG